MFSELESNSTIDALARCRQTVLARAARVLDTDAPPSEADGRETLRNIMGLLMTSLEGLKVAEEELREQNDRLREQRASVNDRLRHYRSLFLASPMPSIITDMYASMLEMNYAATELFRREARHLERKPLVTLVAPESRDTFRRQLLNFPIDETTRAWPIVLQRTGDVPIPVPAIVRRVSGLGPTQSGVLYWVLEPQAALVEAQP